MLQQNLVNKWLWQLKTCINVGEPNSRLSVIPQYYCGICSLAISLGCKWNSTKIFATVFLLCTSYKGLWKIAFSTYSVVQKNAPTSADYNYDPVQSILIIFSKLFVNNHKSCLVVKFSTSPHICCHYTLWNTMLYFALITQSTDQPHRTVCHHHYVHRTFRRAPSSGH